MTINLEQRTQMMRMKMRTKKKKKTKNIQNNT
jgi:hypothetical protein